MQNEVLRRIQDNVAKVMIGKEEVTKLLLASLAAGGHVLLEDVPGTGKTVLAKTLAKSMGCQFDRVQFTPDLLPTDVTGLSFFNQEKGCFTFKEGPVFTNVLLADEINTQNTVQSVGVYGRETGYSRWCDQSIIGTIFCHCDTESNRDNWMLSTA